MSLSPIKFKLLSWAFKALHEQILTRSCPLLTYGEPHCSKTAATQGLYPETSCSLWTPYTFPVLALLKNVTLEPMSVHLPRGGKLSKVHEVNYIECQLHENFIDCVHCCVPNTQQNCQAYNRCSFKTVDWAYQFEKHNLRLCLFWDSLKM